MKKRILLSIIATAIFTCSSAAENAVVTSDNLKGHQKFRGAGLVMEGQEQWYRELRLEDWEAMGITAQEITEVLDLIDGGKTLRDESNENAQGNWTYEFSKQASAFGQLAKTQDKIEAAISYQKAATLWMIASYPNLQTKYELTALENAVDAYVIAANHRGEMTEKVSMPLEGGRSITGILHLPKGVTNPPVVLWTGGVDKSLVEHHVALIDTVNNGTAVLTFDMPGAGLNSDSVMQLGSESIAHEAALAFVQSDPRLDKTRIAALSQSGAGIALMEFAIDNPELNAIVARCAVVDGVLTKPDLFLELPLMTSQSFGKRIGADINDLGSFGELTIPLSLKTKGYFDGKPRMDTPMLVINTSGDTVASVEDMKATAALSSQGVVEFYGTDGHCPEGQEAANSITNFLAENI